MPSVDRPDVLAIHVSYVGNTGSPKYRVVITSKWSIEDGDKADPEVYGGLEALEAYYLMLDVAHQWEQGYYQPPLPF